MKQFRLSNPAALAIFGTGVGVVASTLLSVGAEGMMAGQVASLVIGLVLMAYAALSGVLNRRDEASESGRKERVLRHLDDLIEKVADESWDFPKHDPRKAGKLWNETRKFLARNIGGAETDQRFMKPTKTPELYEALWSEKDMGAHRFLDNVVIVLREIRDAIRDGELGLKGG